ncbi:hypothetical protein IWX92DRAFT_36271 [Phyllosticta citricarpa]
MVCLPACVAFFSSLRRFFSCVCMRGQRDWVDEWMDGWDRIGCRIDCLRVGPPPPWVSSPSIPCPRRERVVCLFAQHYNTW